MLIEETNRINYARMLNVALDNELDDATNYAYLLTSAVRSRSDAQYIEYTMWTQDGEVVEALEKTNAHRETEMLAGDVITYTLDGTNEDDVQMIKSVSKIADNGETIMEAAILGCTGDDLRVITAMDDKVFQVDDDTIAIYIHSNNKTMEQGDADATGYDYTANRTNRTDVEEYYVNALFQLDNDGSTIKFILIDLDGELTGGVVDTENKNSHVLAADENLQTALKTYRSVTVPFAYKIPAGTEIDVPNGVSLTFEGALNLNGTINGDFTANTVVAGTGSKLNGTMTVLEGAGTDLDKLTSDTGAEIILKDEASTAAGFYRPDPSGNGDGVALSGTIPAATYTWSTFKVNGTATKGWMVGTTGGSKTLPVTASANDIQSALYLYDNVTISGTIAIGANLIVPANKTLNVTGNMTINDGVTMTVDGKLDVDGKLVVGSGSGADLKGTGTIVAEEVGAAGSTGSVSADLDMTVEAGDAANLVNWAIIADAGVKVSLKSDITTTGANQFFYTATVAVPNGDVAPAGTYVKNGNGWLLTTNVASITFKTNISNTTVQAAFEHTGVVKLDGSCAPTNRIDVEAGQTVEIGAYVSLAQKIAVQGTLKVNGARTITLSNIIGVAGGTVIFSDDLTGINGISGFYSEKGVPVTMTNEVAGHTFKWTADTTETGTAAFLAQ